MERYTSNAVIDTVIIQTMRMQELVEFYQMGFGLSSPQPFGDDHLGFQLSGVYLGFDQVLEIQGKTPGAVSAWFRVDDLQTTFDRLVALGATIKYAPVEKPWGDQLAAVFDPDGNLIGLSQRQ